MDLAIQCLPEPPVGWWLLSLCPYADFHLAFVTANPPESVQTEISLSQYLAIQEKGVSAWEFEPELEIANCFVEARTEIEFFDSECTVLTNLPVPKQNDVYYWEAKIYDKPENTLLSIGMATKPYPLFRLPGKIMFRRLDQESISNMSQDSTSTQLRINLRAIVGTISPSARTPTARPLFKEMSLELDTDPGRVLFSSPAMARSSKR